MMRSGPEFLRSPRRMLFRCPVSLGARNAVHVPRIPVPWPAAGRLGHPRAVPAGRDPAHHLLGDAVPAPQHGPPRRGLPSADRARLPLLALVDHRHGDQGMGRDPPQAPRQVRNRRRPAQSPDARHQGRAADRQRDVPGRSQEPRDAREVRPQHAERLDRTQSVHALQLAGRRRDAGDQPDAVRCDRCSGLGTADGMDPNHRGRHHQRHRSLVGLSQFRGVGCIDQHFAVGRDHRRRRAAQQPPHLSDLGQAVGQALRVRHRLGLYPRSRDAWPGQGAQDAADAQAGRCAAGG